MFVFFLSGEGEKKRKREDDSDDSKPKKRTITHREPRGKIK